jgi:hypothetical protein
MAGKPAGGPPGKLQGAARHWLSGARRRDPEALQRSAEGLGIRLPAAILEQPAADDIYAVWPENWSAIELFLRCETQWRMGLNRPIGLDYQALITVAKMYRMCLPSVLEDVQVMEATILSELNKR